MPYFSQVAQFDNRIYRMEDILMPNDRLEEARKRIIVALDVPSLEKAGDLIEALALHVGSFKVGLELTTAEGAPQAIDFVHVRGGRVSARNRGRKTPGRNQLTARF